MSGNAEEWLKQADYDMETAEIMFKNDRFFYAVFMCHLSIEKGLKSLFLKSVKEIPLKSHNLIYLLIKIGKRPEPELEKFIARLNTASVATRYPDDLTKIQEAFTQTVTQEILTKSKEVLHWIKKQF